MRKKVFTLLNEAQQKLSGHTMYMNYHFIHFSVKADAAALLAVIPEVGGEALNLEDVADVAIPEEDQFAIIPKDSSYLFPICKAIAAIHPEYKIEQKSMSDEISDDDTEENQESGEDSKYILCTMPAVNKERHDAGLEYVKTVFDETQSKLQEISGAYAAKITKELADAKPEEIDEAKEELQKLHDQHTDLCKSYREEKEKQIEEAYQKYLKAQAEKESAEKEKQAAHGKNAGKQMSMEGIAANKE